MNKRIAILFPALIAMSLLYGNKAPGAVTAEPLWVGDVAALSEFTGTDADPYQILQFKVVNRLNEPLSDVRVYLRSDSIETSSELKLDFAADEKKIVTIRFRAKPEIPEGAMINVTAVAESGEANASRDEKVAVSKPDWKMFFVPGFHYDPEWWNTQYNYLELYNENRQRGVFFLIKDYLDAARKDPDFKFVLESIPYLKPYWDVYPEDRAYLRELIKAGRLELMGGSYNEPQSTLVSGEANIRNLIYGILYERGVWGGNPETSWQCDVFGHTPNWPQFNVKSGITGSSWARGPFHRWKIDRNSINFPQDFFWVSPDGSKLLTSYMSCFYGCGRPVNDPPEKADGKIADFFNLQRINAVTPNILLPMSDDFIIPDKNIGATARAWNAKHINPKVYVGTVKDFFDSMRCDAEKKKVRFPDVSRDMNPVFKGCAVSYIDQKQANREIENRVTAAESFSSIASMLGAKYPSIALDKAWRELLFFSHHDGITGSESDQVYLDLSNSLREAYELSGDSLNRALNYIGGRVRTDKFARPVAVFNPLAWARRDVAVFDVAPHKTLSIKDYAGKSVPVQKIDAEHVATVVETPAMGYAVYDIKEIKAEKPAPKTVKSPVTIRNEFYVLTVDPAKGGTITSLIEKKAGRNYLRDDADSLGNDLVAYKEYPSIAGMGEGPWSIIPTGERFYSHDYPAEVTVEQGPVFSRIEVKGPFKNTSREQRITLFKGIDRIDFETRVIGFDDKDWLFRVQFPASISGGRPVYEVANAAVARPFTFDVDTNKQRWLIENAAYNWVDVTTPLKLEVVAQGKIVATRSMGVGEIVLPDEELKDIDEAAYKLVTSLVRRTVTTTPTRAGKRRYGDISLDSNLPDFRITAGPISRNAYTAEVVSGLPKEAADKLKAAAAGGTALLWVDERPDNIPVLIVTGPDQTSVYSAIAGIDEMISKSNALTLDTDEYLGDFDERAGMGGFTLINLGTPSYGVLSDGQIMLDLFRSNSAWPSGLWIDPPRRTLPDGSNFQFNHWPHVFKYSVRLHSGDWRAVNNPRAGYEANFPLITKALSKHKGDLPTKISFVSVAPDNFVLTALKPAGYPEASFRKNASAGDDFIIRLYESYGDGGEARIQMFKTASAAWKTDMLEKKTSALKTRGGAVSIKAGPFSTETFGVRIKREARKWNKTVSLGREKEPLQPTNVRWWRYNVGAAPLGFLPLTLRFNPESTDVPADGSAVVKLAVASSYIDTGSKGVVVFDAPTGIQVSPNSISYDVKPNDYSEYQVTVTAAAVKSGNYHVHAVITEPSGQKIEDVIEVRVGSGIIALDGEWKFKTGTNNTWSKSEFDDTRWKLMPVPGSWKNHGIGDFLGYGWYRRVFNVPADWKGRNVVMRFNNGVDDHCDVYVNGVRAGGSDQKQANRRFEIVVPPEALKYGARNQITIRVYNAMGEGGIKGPVIMGSDRDLGPQFAAELSMPKLTLAPGKKGKAALRIVNFNEEPLEGEVWLTSPYEAWPLFKSHRIPFSAPPLGSASVVYPVSAPADFTPGAYWAVFKITANGKFVFSDTMAVDIVE